MTYFYNTVTEAIITYNELKQLYPMFGWPINDNGASVDARLLMDNIHPDILQYKRLAYISMPSVGRYEVAERSNPELVSGQWQWGWSVRAMTPQEIEIVDSGLFELMKQYRDADWQNANITLTNGAILQINERTRRDVQDTLTGLITLGVNEYGGWNAVNGVYDMSIPLFQEAIAKALLRVKKSFDAFNSIKQNHYNTPYEDDSWKTDFDNFVEG